MDLSVLIIARRKVVTAAMVLLLSHLGAHLLLTQRGRRGCRTHTDALSAPARAIGPELAAAWRARVGDPPAIGRFPGARSTV